MGPPSSGGLTIGEALNILEGFELGAVLREEALHDYLEASKLSFADRNAFLGDADDVYVPLAELLSQAFTDERRELIGPTAAEPPVAPSDPCPHDDDPEVCEASAGPSASSAGSTTHLAVADASGNS